MINVIFVYLLEIGKSTYLNARYYIGNILHINKKIKKFEHIVDLSFVVATVLERSSIDYTNVHVYVTKCSVNIIYIYR